jgi:hypothetical protein
LYPGTQCRRRPPPDLTSTIEGHVFYLAQGYSISHFPYAVRGRVTTVSAGIAAYVPCTPMTDITDTADRHRPAGAHHSSLPLFAAADAGDVAAAHRRVLLRDRRGSCRRAGAHTRRGQRTHSFTNTGIPELSAISLDDHRSITTSSSRPCAPPESFS